MILSYHLLLLWICSPISVCVGFGCLFLVLFACLFLGVLPGFLDERDSA